MSLFQESIIRKHLGYLDQELVDQAYLRFNEVYSAKKISNIKIAKEEQYQEGFIKDIFGAVLGYSVFPEQPFNIQTEKKNESNSKKADGAIFKGENVVGVIELKDNKTRNLDAVKDQAFGYKNNHKECSYVISSNFHKLRFYLDDATDYEEFDLYNLDKETFKRFYLYLQKEGLLDKNIPKLLRQETKFHEENITKSLYKDYSSFKNSFFQNVVKNNPQYDKLLLFKKSQKFLDKVLFVLFAEDKGLVATNSIVQIVEKWNDLKNDAFDTPKPLYELIALFFSNLFIGKKDQKGGVLIPEFGGEIFAPDEVLDALMVDDEVLQDDLLKLSKYDFNTDVDVNILGHIFEHSLSEIEEVEASLKGEVADKTKGKRKKDGVFYTPKYITKYIVENTVGKLCSEKKTELKLDVDIAIFEHQKADGKLNAKGIELYATLNQYKDWLLTLKILDPACGSGAFLNQAVNFLVLEHKFADDIIAELTNSPLRLFDTDIAILENNIYGVDINEESIEIAKLSLWLRTAQQGRKLSNLSNNIKCGNSLIDDPAVAGDKAFNWQNEFPEVFANGGFDVIVGNPPYVGIEGIIWEDKKYYESAYSTATGRFDLYVLFIEKAMKIRKKLGFFSFIVPGKILNNKQFQHTRKIISENQNVYVLKIEDKVFNEAQVDSVILLNHGIKEKELNKYYAFRLTAGNVELLSETLIENILNDDEHIFRLEISNVLNYLIKKIENNTVQVIQIALVKDGIIAGLIKDILYLNNKVNENCKKLYFGKHISKYYSGDTDVWVNYNPEEMMKEEMIRKGGKGPGLRMRDSKIFNREKLLTRFVGKEIIATYDNENKYYEHTVHSTHITDERFDHKYLLCLFNSRVLNFYYQKTNSQGGDIFPQVRISSVEKLPIKVIDEINQQPFIEKANLILALNVEFREFVKKFQRSLERKFELKDLQKKLEDWYLLSYSDFIKELAKKKIKLSLSDEAEWEEYFNTESKKALELKSQIDETDKEIDQLVYKLYDLTEEEIAIVEKV